MRIQILGSRLAEGFTDHIASGFEQLGHEVRVVEYYPVAAGSAALGPTVRTAQSAFRLLRRGSGALSRRLIDRVLRMASKDGPWDLALSVYDWLTPDEVAEWKARTGARVALWFPDAISNLGRMYFLQADYDAVFLKDPYMVQLFRANLGKNVHYLPECFDPVRHGAAPPDAEERSRYGTDVAFIGSAYPYRIEILRRLLHRQVRVWGSPAPRWCSTSGLESVLTGRFVSYETKAKVLLSAKIVVNTFHPAEIWGVNVKTFEIAGIGAFQLCDWRPGVAELFEPGEEIETFRDFAELDGKIERYLGDGAARARIAAAGRRRALAEHTYSHRLRSLLDVVFRDGEAWPVRATW